MYRQTNDTDFESIYQIINSAAVVYKDVIPDDRWKEPYMPRKELAGEIKDGVVFWCWESDGRMIGVMGIQDVKDVTLIRHAYTHPDYQRQGIGSMLLKHLAGLARRPLLIGTWKAARWAISFYEKQGFTMVTETEKNMLLNKYWNIPARQVETSVVLSSSPVDNLCEPAA